MLPEQCALYSSSVNFDGSLPDRSGLLAMRSAGTSATFVGRIVGTTTDGDKPSLALSRTGTGRATSPSESACQPI